MQKGKNRKNNYCYFNNISDFTNYLRSNENKPWLSTADNTEYRTKWCGGLSYQDSYKRLIVGDDEIANSINKVKIDEVKSERITAQYVNDIQGVIPNVSNFLMGLPQSMIDVKLNRVKTNNKIINLVFDTSISCGINSEDYFKVAKLFFDVVDKLELAGYRCNIYLISIFNSMPGPYKSVPSCNFIIKLKSSIEPFNRHKNSFILAHPSMERRIFFRALEVEGLAKSDGYGGYDYGVIPRTEEVPQIVEEAFGLFNLPTNNLKVFSVYKYINVEEETIIHKILN